MAVWEALLLVALARYAVSQDASKSSEDNDDGRIEGHRAQNDRAPYVIYLYIEFKYSNNTYGSRECGGSIIDDNWGLTAASCLYVKKSEGQVKSIKIKAGDVNWKHNNCSLYAKNHYLYDENDEESINDIALLEFESRIHCSFSMSIREIHTQPSKCMDYNYEDDKMKTFGWGLTKDKYNRDRKSLKNILHWVYQKGISNKMCQEYLPEIKITPAKICSVYSTDETQGALEGDIGAPIVVERYPQRVQVGIHTYLGVGKIPDGYFHGGTKFLVSVGIRPGYYHKWLLDKTGIDFDRIGPDPLFCSPRQCTGQGGYL